jgi:hypothetical protein
VPEVLEAQPRPGAAVESGQLGRAVQHARLDVAISERGPGAGAEHPRLFADRRQFPTMFPQSGDELGSERDVTIGGGGLKRDTPCRGTATGVRELRPDVELAAVEVEVRPDQA